MKPIIIIRIAGIVNRSADIEDTLDKLKLRRKYACSVFSNTPEIMGMIKKVRSFTAYGNINKETLVELIKQRGEVDKKNNPKQSDKIDAEKSAESILKNGNFENTGLKPFFRLHPPRKGINTKQHFPHGVLGDHGEKINELIRRML
ncbi:MAG: uL30 family ribosomal protein [Nanoarchaeota archaeon]